jgi:hypothetical protein
VDLRANSSARRTYRQILLNKGVTRDFLRLNDGFGENKGEKSKTIKTNHRPKYLPRIGVKVGPPSSGTTALPSF